MMEKFKALLHRLVDGLVVLIVMLLAVVYVGAAGITMTAVINDLRLDTYVDVSIGTGIVLLVMLLVWVPLLFLFRSPWRR